MANTKHVHEAIELIQRISGLFEKLNPPASVISALEKDMLLDYTRQLYDRLLQLNAQTVIADRDLSVAEKVSVAEPLHSLENKEPVEFEETVLTKENYSETVKVEQKISEERAKTISKSAKPVSQSTSLFDDIPAVADRFEEKTTVHDKILKTKEDKSVAEKLSSMPLLDLKKSIGINEKFKFVNELFDGNLQDYNNAIDALNNFTSFMDAQNHIEQAFVSKYNWQRESGVYQSLLFLVQRKFNF